jgi:hypothetical protein
MSLIVAGTFPDRAHAIAAIDALLQSGIEREAICEFAVNPPGQHHVLPAGGDHHSSTGAHTGGAGAAKGAAIGGAVGLGLGIAAAPVTGPVGPVGGAALGAYVGSFAGAVGNLGEKEGHPETEEAPIRPAGVLVAVHASTTPAESLAVNILRERQANPVERALGTWRDGSWVDFDPASTPNPVN